MGTIISAILHVMTEDDIKLKINWHFQNYYDMPCAQLGLYLILAEKCAKKYTVQKQVSVGVRSQMSKTPEGRGEDKLGGGGRPFSTIFR